MNETCVGDARFYARRGPFPLGVVAAAAGASAACSKLMLTGVAPLQLAGPSEISFLDSARYAALLDATRAGAVIVQPDMAARVPKGAVAVVASSAAEAWVKVAQLFHPCAPLAPGAHPTAFVAPGAEVCPTAEIGPFAYVGPGARIGPRCRIGAHATIEAGVVIGQDCRIGAGATVSHALLGERIVLHPGVRIGQDGFGLARAGGGLVSLPQLGRVVIGDDVEIGANATIDRGAVRDTVIGAGSRLDNLVHIGHNVQLGRCCVMVAQVGVAGSAVLEDFVQVGGQAAIAGHTRIGQGAQIAGQAGVISDVPAAAVMMGTPAQPKTQFFRQIALLRRLAGGRGEGRALPGASGKG
jgi:UDP-3-O-[3-hydroxymyristoyl] glucosamine N-acyltransferase